MKKIFTLIAGLALAAGVSAVTPYKNLYVAAEVSPSGAGVVYLAPKAEDTDYLFDCSDDWDETAWIKYVGGENGDGSDVVGCNKPEVTASPNGTYELIVYTEANDGYELVCYADKVKDDGVYTESDVYPTIIGATQNERTWHFEWPETEEGNMINVNNVDSPQTGDSNGEPLNRDGCLADESLWPDTPDTYIYVIFREVGADLPRFDAESVDGVSSVKAEKQNNGALFNVAGQQVNKAAKGIVVANGKKVLVK